MSKKYCTVCDTTVIPEYSNFQLKCPNCKTAFPEDDSAKPLTRKRGSLGIGFGTDRTSVPGRGTRGWG